MNTYKYPIEIESVTAETWINAGSIQVTEFGNENTYYVNEFGHTFYCKNYPQLYGVRRVDFVRCIS